MSYKKPSFSPRFLRGDPLGQRLPLLHRAQRPSGGGEADPAEGAGDAGAPPRGDKEICGNFIIKDLYGKIASTTT